MTRIKSAPANSLWRLASNMTNGPKVTVITNTNASSVRALTGYQGPAEIKHQVKAQPTLVGSKGRAWLCDIDVGRRRLGSEKRDATIAVWVVEAPWAHPIWHSYTIASVHLRPIPGVKTLIYKDMATHEMWVHALNPDAPLDELIETGINRGLSLKPTQFAAQFIEIEDEYAAQRIEKTVREIIDGKLSPDVDHQRCCWVPRFGDNMMKDRALPRDPKVKT